MDDRWNELQSRLLGLQPGMAQEYEKLAELFLYQVFELHPGDGASGEPGDYYIPYMMNDALECYLVSGKGWEASGYWQRRSIRLPEWRRRIIPFEFVLWCL